MKQIIYQQINIILVKKIYKKIVLFFLRTKLLESQLITVFFNLMPNTAVFIISSIKAYDNRLPEAANENLEKASTLFHTKPLFMQDRTEYYIQTERRCAGQWTHKFIDKIVFILKRLTKTIFIFITLNKLQTQTVFKQTILHSTLNFNSLVQQQMAVILKQKNKFILEKTTH